MSLLPFILLFGASFAAGIVNTLAGGGSFLTFPALLLTGLDARAANISSTLALYPMQVSTGYAGRAMAGGTDQLSLRALSATSLVGGALGAILLLLTPPVFFAHLVPWLILAATLLFAYGSFFHNPSSVKAKSTPYPFGTIAIQLCISIYGGYFGGGIGFLMLAALSLAGVNIRKAGATKNILAAIINSAAVFIFLFSRDIGWYQVAIGAIASVAGGVIGVKLLRFVNERVLRFAVVILGCALTIAMFLYAS